MTGVIGDTHLPFTLPGYREFVKKTFDLWGVDRVVHIGDLIDHHAISFHTSEVDALSPSSELELALRELELWKKDFPEMYICKGNHDKLPERKLKDIGLPGEWLRGIEEVYEFPTGWEIDIDWEFDGVLYTHTATGITGARNLAKTNMMSTVCGHAHSQAGVSYMTNHRGKSIFGMYVGCGVDVKSYAMRYGKDYKEAPVIGCGVVVNSTEAHFIPMKE